MPPAVDGAGLRRRNGKQQACEPCRKGKLACGHERPFCQRCVRRKITSRCEYHPAPMTKTRPPLASPESTLHHTSPNINGQPSHQLSPLQHIVPAVPQTLSNWDQGPSRRTSNAHSTVTNGNDNQAQGNPTTATPGTPGSTQSNLDRFFSWDKDAVFQRSARYYGPTSFSAVFKENASLDKDLNIGDEGRKNPANWRYGEPLLGRERPSAPSVRMRQIVKALWNIPSREICEKLLETLSALHNYLQNDVMVKHCIETLFSTFGNELAVPRTSEKLVLIADVMFRNEERPLPPAPEDGMDWINGFMGPNLRFETLGMLFCFFGMSYQTLQDWDPLFQTPENNGRDRKETSWRMKECADICLKMCEISEENNEISIALMHCISILESVCTGDESFQLRRRHGDLIVCAIAAGIHRLPDYDSVKITAASEYKRRLFSVIYGSDKNHASLNGTPPSLSARFCNVRLPLDISEEDLFLPQEEFAAVVAKLDPNGWNTSGKLYRSTFHRALHLIQGSCEEILEISLGVGVPLSADKIDNLYQSCQEVYDRLPNQVHYYGYDKIPKMNVSSTILVSQAYLLLNLLQNRFLIDRVAIARGFQNEQRLLSTAMEMMDLTIMFWIKRDQLMRFSSAFDWIITCYGIPSAGVICVELLKQATGQSILQFSRSDAIQKLTMFIGFLEWIRPTDGNYMLAGRLKKVVRRILDRVLDPPRRDEMGTDLMDVPIDPMLAPFGEMDWLNTIDWTQGSWIDFN